jgi:hypothetical protein
LATGSVADEQDEYLKIGETTSMEAMKNLSKMLELYLVTGI